MRILHTSDWHLGRFLNNFSRINEQEQFIDELEGIVNERSIDLIIIAGDIYDTVNPPAAAERLFYGAMRRLSDCGKRPVVVLAGNHDNPMRLTASSPLAAELGIIFFGTPKSIPQTGDFGGYSVTASGEGFAELRIGEEKAVILAMPYPSEKRLGELINSPESAQSGDERDFQINYSERIGEIFAELSKKYGADTVNLAAGHFYTGGGEISGSERDISIGGCYAVEPTALPAGARYIALGHLHRAQRIKKLNAYYSGSPIAYDIGESKTPKSVFIAELGPGPDAEALVEKVYLRDYKPYVRIDAADVGEAVEKIKTLGDCWLTVRINAGRQLTASEIKELRLAKNDILDILCDDIEATEREPEREDMFLSPEKQFTDFYTEKRGTAPSGEMTALFLELSYFERDLDDDTGLAQLRAKEEEACVQ